MDELKLTGFSRLGLRRLDHASSGGVNASGSAKVGAREKTYISFTKSKIGWKPLADIKNRHGNPGGLSQARSCVDEIATCLSLFA